MLLSELTTLRLGGPADEFVVAETEAALIEAVAEADTAGTPLLILGGGSNLVIPDAGFAGRVVQVATSGVSSVVEERAARLETEPLVVAAAGEIWDEFVAWTIVQGFAGLESLSGIPGTVGATPVQNVGAYGDEVADTIEWVRVLDRNTRGVHTLNNAECGFGYRTSRFKQDTRFVVLSVAFRLPAAGANAARRSEVLELRRSKGMVLDAADHDTWSVGSFFTNPFVPANRVPEGAPTYPTLSVVEPVETVKVPAAWLIEQAGFPKGHTSAEIGPEVSLSSKHTLALTNRGGATTEQLLALAREVRDGVEERFGIRLLPEPTLVGITL